jgi:hypothetical protein
MDWLPNHRHYGIVYLRIIRPKSGQAAIFLFFENEFFGTDSFNLSLKHWPLKILMMIKELPLGDPTFVEIIDKDLLYSDKTRFVYELVKSKGKNFFYPDPAVLARPLYLKHLRNFSLETAIVSKVFGSAALIMISQNTQLSFSV